MKKIFTLTLLTGLFCHQLFAQPTQAEIDKMMKQAQEMMNKYGNDSTVKNAMKGIQDKQKQVSEAMKNQQGNNTTNSSVYVDLSDYSNVDNWKFPAKNIALLSSLPRKIFTKTELISFINDVYTQLSKKFYPGISSSVQNIAAKYNNDGNKMADAAISGWYNDYREESLLLILKAAVNNPNDGMLLNNCAALLNMNGIEHKAIPILKYILQSYPNSAMVLNNLGQAYAGLGETDTAMVYLGRCIKIEPENPEANNTAGQIEATKGNKEKAIEYFEKSIKSAYTKTAELKLRKIKKGSKIVPLIRPRVKIPEYFNQFKYDLPGQCTKVENSSLSDAEHVAFRKMVADQLEPFSKQMAVLGQKNYNETIQRINSGGKGRIIKKDEFIAQPYYELCGIMARDLMAEFVKAVGDLSNADKKYYEEMKRIESEYNGLLEILKKGFAERDERCCGEGKIISCCPSSEEVCTAYNNLANQYLPKFAYLTEEWQQKNKHVFTTYFDEVIYWGYLSYHPAGYDYFYTQVFYPMVSQYLGMLSKICYTKIITPCGFKSTTATKESNTINEYDCPLEFEIPFVVGKFELNCEKFSFKAGEGVVFGYEKNFKTHQSTVSIGIGLKLELEGKAGPVKAGVSTSVGESLFITFDGENKFSDGGLKFDAKASAGIEAEAGKSVKGKKDIIKEETGIGYTVGINSGWNFNEGPFKGMVK